MKFKWKDQHRIAVRLHTSQSTDYYTRFPFRCLHNELKTGDLEIPTVHHNVEKLFIPYHNIKIMYGIWAKPYMSSWVATFPLSQFCIYNCQILKKITNTLYRFQILTEFVML